MRARLQHTVKDGAGNVVQNARVFVYEKGTVTPVPNLYTAEVGGSLLASLVSDAQGIIEGWLQDPRTVTLSITDNSDTAYYPSVPLRLLDWVPFSEDVDVHWPPSAVGTANGIVPLGPARKILPEFFDAESAANLTPRMDVAEEALTATVNKTGDQTIAGTKTFAKIVVKEHPVDIRHPDFGGVDPTGVELSRTALQAALNFPGPSGGEVFIPDGNFAVDAQVVVPNHVLVRGLGGRRSNIVAKAGAFPINTPVVRLGADAQRFEHGIRLERLGITCSDIAGSGGVYSNTLQEPGGMYQVVVRAFRGTGVLMDNTAVDRFVSHFEMDGCEILPSVMNADVGVRFNNIGNTGVIRRSTIGSVNGMLNDCIYNDGSIVSVENVHLEGATDGIDLQGTLNGKASMFVTNLTGLGGATGVTNLIHVRDASPLVVIDAKDYGSPVTLLDDLLEVTLTGTVAFYTNRDAYFGHSRVAPSLQGLVSARVRLGDYATPRGTYGQTSQLPIGDMRLVPMVIPAGRKWRRLRINVAAAGGAGLTARLGIYADTGDGKPGVLLLDAGTVDVSIAGSRDIDFTNLLIKGSLVWLAVASQGAGTPIAALSQVVNPVGFNGTDPDLAAGPRVGRLLTGITGALPADLTATTLSYTNFCIAAAMLRA